MKKYLSEDVYGTEYEGYTTYDDKNMYVSGDSDGVNSVLFMLPISLDEEMDMNAALAVVIMLLLIAFLYCPAACRLCISATDELTGSSGSESDLIFDDKGPLMVFVEWFAYFFTAFSVFALYSAYSMDWIDFTFVFVGMWSRGIHLFSLWAVLFFVSFTLSALSAMHRLIKDAQRRTALRTGTLLKLLDSLLNYATFIALLIGILYMFGVNTKALLASAGIVSIAVGMGSQTMIQDILAGLFLAMEDSIHLGDLVTIGESTGRVTDMGIRTTTITDEHQNTMTINNSNISDVTNMSRKKTLSELELTLARTTGMSETEKILENAIDEVSEEITELDGSLKLEGLINIKNDSFTVRLSFSCDEISREDVTRQLSELITLKVAEGMEEATAAED
ncbi:MAG: mechanosensitive ion channel family protein [Butyrivibrio sp.]|nr:mechanosensitive ion channel family protein [Butyrivibrio sp.]